MLDIPWKNRIVLFGTDAIDHRNKLIEKISRYASEVDRDNSDSIRKAFVKYFFKNAEYSHYSGCIDMGTLHIKGGSVNADWLGTGGLNEELIIEEKPECYAIKDMGLLFPRCSIYTIAFNLNGDILFDTIEKYETIENQMNELRHDCDAYHLDFMNTIIENNQKDPALLLQDEDDFIV